MPPTEPATAPRQTQQATREQIAAAADRLFHEQGYDHTSFAHIAGAVGISRGNFYYHFRTKDEILAAVIALRLARTQAILDGWHDGAGTPAERIRRFIGMLVENAAGIARHGCPVGSLCGELAKLAHPSREEAARLFTLFRTWLRARFAELGCPADEADRHALHALVRSQGIAALASAFHDEAVIHAEARLLDAWLDGIVARLPAAT